MKKTVCLLVVSLVVSSGAAFAEYDALKSLGKETGKAVVGSAKENVLGAITKKLKKVQSQKGPIKFKPGSAVVDPACDKTMIAIAAIMADYPGFHVQVDGHTDNVGKPEANLKLSQERADAVVKYLVDKKGVDAARLSAKGFGDTQPIADNKTKKGQAKNRRVDFTVTKM